MNKEIKKYIKYVKKIIPFYSKDKKEFLSIPEKSIYLSFASSNVKLPSLCTLCLDMKPGILS